MSPVTAPPPRVRALRVERAPAIETREPAKWREPAAIFAIAFAIYAGVGIYTTLQLEIVLGDAESRLMHAYHVWWNDPAKLTAIGFYWPPLQTLSLLPGALIRPLATSLVALPLTSAFFAALLVAFVDRALALARLERGVRWALTAAFAINPMIAYYATNGMAESLSLAFLAAGLYFFVRWSLHPRWQDLPLMGVALALGVVSRYEIAFWAPLVVAGVVALLLSRRGTADRIEASVLAVVVPIGYAALLWVFVNWMIVGDPTAFLAVASRPDLPPAGGPLELSAKIVATHLALFPPTLLLGIAMIGGGALRRNATALVLGAALLMNAAVSVAFVLYTPEAVPLLLRYNMRGIPVVLIAVAWLLTRVTLSRRNAVALAAAAAVIVSNVATGATMLRAPDQLGEHAFLTSLFTAKSQDAEPGPRGPGLSMADQRDMAAFIARTVRGRNAILADDSQTFGVILHDGHPERYLDRIDISDERWLIVRDDPVGRVRYVLVHHSATRSRDPVFYDRILERYPSLGRDDPPAFLRLVHRNATYALYAVQS